MMNDPLTSHGSIEIVRAIGDEPYRMQMIDVVVSRMKLSEMYFTGVRQRFPRLYDLWRGTWTGRFHPHKNNAHIPLIYSAIWSDAARKAATSLSTYPIMAFIGYGPDDSPVCRKWEGLIAAQMKDDDAFMKEVDNIVSADLYGVSIQQHGWCRKEEYQILESIDRMPITGKVVRSIKRGNVVTFDGPTTEQIDLLDFFPQPGVKRLRDMKWVVRRFFLDWDDVLYMAKQGIYDAREVGRIAREGGVNSQIADQQSMIRRFATRAGMDDESIRWMDKYARPIEILEFWGEVPGELSPDGELKRVITVANRRYMLRNKPNPFWHKKIPFTSFSPTPDPHYFYAPGKGEIIEKLQIIGNRYLNQSLDAADLVVDPMWFYDRAANLNTKALYARPGRFIPVDGNPANVVAAMQKDLAGLTVADQRISMVSQYAQQGTGIIDDAVQGLGGDSRQTAREFVGRREAAGNRLGLEARIYEEMSLEPHANMMVAMDKQFLDTPAEIKILGDGARIDPVTGNPISGTREIVTDEDMLMSYAARAMGASMALSKSTQQQNMMGLLQALGTPVGQSVMGAINAVNFWRSIFRTFEVPNMNEIFNGEGQADFNGLINQANNGQPGGLAAVPTSGQVVAGGAGALPLPGAPGTSGPGAVQNTLPPMQGAA
jgi:hypothetical protein